MDYTSYMYVYVREITDGHVYNVVLPYAYDNASVTYPQLVKEGMSLMDSAFPESTGFLYGREHLEIMLIPMSSGKPKESSWKYEVTNYSMAPDPRGI